MSPSAGLYILLEDANRPQSTRLGDRNTFQEETSHNSYPLRYNKAEFDGGVARATLECPDHNQPEIFS